MTLLLLPVLAALIATACGGAAGGGDDRGRVAGQVHLGPMCPVETQASPCPDQPLSDATIEAVKDGSVIATAVTDAEGRFSIELEAGDYAVRVALGTDPARSSQPVEVTVRVGEATSIDLTVDSGIR